MIRCRRLLLSFVSASIFWTLVASGTAAATLPLDENLEDPVELRMARALSDVSSFAEIPVAPTCPAPLALTPQAKVAFCC